MRIWGIGITALRCTTSVYSGDVCVICFCHLLKGWSLRTLCYRYWREASGRNQGDDYNHSTLIDLILRCGEGDTA
jgi:steroid 5-alpha reductase family enzyme